MKADKFTDALGGVNEAYVEKSAPRAKKRGKASWIAAVAAVLAAAVIAGIVFHPGLKPQNVTPSPVPGVIGGFALAAPTYPAQEKYPGDGGDQKTYHLWWQQRRDQQKYYGAGKDLYPFFEKLEGRVFSGRRENTVLSPVNVYMALSMLVSLTDGDTRAQLLSLLGLDSAADALDRADRIWQANYSDDGLVTSLMGNSVWLKEGFPVKEAVLKTLAEKCYAASFKGDFADDRYVKALKTWLNEQTGNLLEDAVAGLEIDPETVLTLLSTLYFRAQWQNKFAESETREETFHALTGDETARFMHRTELFGRYYWGERFGAMRLPLSEAGDVWFFLPDEGVTPDELFADEEALSLMRLFSDMSAVENYPKSKTVVTHLGVPKFDVASDLDLKGVLQALGVKKAFSARNADFSPLTDESGVFVSGIKHAARVAADEDGVTAAAYTAIFLAGAAAPPADEMDFVLDRPFAFVITGFDGLPLFTGTVFTTAE